MPLILVAVAAFAAVSFWGYLQFTVYDAQRKIANQDYEAAANELMKISFYGKADELLNSPGVGDVEAVIYARAKKQYKAENYIGAMEELVKIQVYEDSGTLLAEYLTGVSVWRLERDRGRRIVFLFWYECKWALCKRKLL